MFYHLYPVKTLPSPPVLYSIILLQPKNILFYLVLCRQCFVLVSATPESPEIRQTRHKHLFLVTSHLYIWLLGNITLLTSLQNTEIIQNWDTSKNPRITREGLRACISDICFFWKVKLYLGLKCFSSAGVWQVNRLVVSQWLKVWIFYLQGWNIIIEISSSQRESIIHYVLLSRIVFSIFLLSQTVR